MSISTVPESVKLRLWGKAAGRCEYEGCNEPLYRDSLTKHEFNSAYVAHIVADSPDGPRGDKVRSEMLKADIGNLMLLCDVHHRLIDKGDVPGHPVDRLVMMKESHERRIEMQTSMAPSKASHVLLFDANIGTHKACARWDAAVMAMREVRYPAERPAFELGLDNSLFRDHEPAYWELERTNLRRQFDASVLPRLQRSDVAHLSVFAVAPQPLLVELGRLLSDIIPADVYQLHREPPDWVWQEHPEAFSYIVEPPPETVTKTVALNLSLSATIDDARITSVLGDDASIWRLTIATPHNDFLKSPEQLRQFREEFRSMMNIIKARHGDDVILHVFPAAPVAVAVEIGRVWMPKADLNLRLYDQNPATGGFGRAFDLRD